MPLTIMEGTHLFLNVGGDRQPHLALPRRHRALFPNGRSRAALSSKPAALKTLAHSVCHILGILTTFQTFTIPGFAVVILAVIFDITIAVALAF